MSVEKINELYRDYLPVTSVSPYNFLNSSNSLPSTIRAMTLHESAIPIDALIND